jgi:hypothetical protein
MSVNRASPADQITNWTLYVSAYSLLFGLLAFAWALFIDAVGALVYSHAMHSVAGYTYVRPERVLVVPADAQPAQLDAPAERRMMRTYCLEAAGGHDFCYTVPVETIERM